MPESLEGLGNSPEDYRARWLREEQRREILDRLADVGVEVRELAAVVHLQDCDPLDIVLNIVFGVPAITRRERVQRVRTEHAEFFAQFGSGAGGILQVILDKYIADEAPDVSNPQLLRVPPLSERGTFMELAQTFGGGAALRRVLKELQARLYAS